MIVLATADFEIYHEVIGELRSREHPFTTVEPGDRIPADAGVIIAGREDGVEEYPVPVVRAEPDGAREAVESALATLRGTEGRRIVGVDPGENPGIAVCSGPTVVAALQVPLEEAPAAIRAEVDGHEDAIVRIGDGARLAGARIINALDDVRIELVDETGTTPSLGTGARRMGDVLAAVNVARMAGTPVTDREIDPTPGELTRIKRRARRQSPKNQTISSSLARRVARGELTVEEALTSHRDDD